MGAKCWQPEKGGANPPPPPLEVDLLLREKGGKKGCNGIKREELEEARGENQLAQIFQAFLCPNSLRKMLLFSRGNKDSLLLSRGAKIDEKTTTKLFCTR